MGEEIHSPLLPESDDFGPVEDKDLGEITPEDTGKEESHDLDSHYRSFPIAF